MKTLSFQDVLGYLSKDIERSAVLWFLLSVKPDDSYKSVNITIPYLDFTEVLHVPQAK